jgi:hypothetical protein
MQVKIKKLKVGVSHGKVFYRVYERGNPGEIPRLKKEIKEVLSDFKSISSLFYARNKDDFVFLGKIHGKLPDGKIGDAVAGEIFSKLRKVMIQILEREEEDKKVVFEIDEIPPSEAAAFLGLEVSDFIANSTGGVVRAVKKKKK